MRKLSFSSVIFAAVQHERAPRSYQFRRDVNFFPDRLQAQLGSALDFYGLQSTTASMPAVWANNFASFLAPVSMGSGRGTNPLGSGVLLQAINPFPFNFLPQQQQADITATSGSSVPTAPTPPSPRLKSPTLESSKCDEEKIQTRL